MMNQIPGWQRKIIWLLFWLLIWQAAAGLIGNRIFLVGPAETLRALGRQVTELSFWSSVWFSLSRIGLGFFAAFFLGLVTGSAASRSGLLREFLEIPIQAMKSVPIASFVILALIWTGSANLSVFISFLVVYPMIHLAALSGIASADPKLLEMARVFRVSGLKKFFYIYRPAMAPYLLSACRTALGMGFKSGIAAEVIGVPDGSIGEGLYMAKIYLSTDELFAWTIVIVAVSAGFERVFLTLLRAAANLGTAKEK